MGQSTRADSKVKGKMYRASRQAEEVGGGNTTTLHLKRTATKKSERLPIKRVIKSVAIV